MKKTKIINFHNCTCRAEEEGGEAPCIHTVPVGYMLKVPVKGNRPESSSWFSSPELDLHLEKP